MPEQKKDRISDQRAAYARTYYQRHRERILMQQKRYRQRKRMAAASDTDDPYLEEADRSVQRGCPLSKRRAPGNVTSRARVYQKIIGEYCERAIAKVQGSCWEKVNALLEKHPFQAFAEQHLYRQLRRFRITPAQAWYDDCYDAGMMAYLYSIHRCAYMGYENVEGYIVKMIRIYLICAIASARDTQVLCRENGFREVRLDTLPQGRI